jgi:cytidylate kinase
MIIAIDGPAACGKGTLGKRLAAHYGLAHLDTGTLYRAVARETLARGADPADAGAAASVARTLDPASLADPGLRAQRLGETASVVARHPEVREALLAYQRSFSRQKPGAVLDGRDIGTVICPDADVKLFVTATPEERARRRFRELTQTGSPVTEAEVFDDIRRRDERDANRAAAPLVRAEDAVLLDTTNLDIDAAFRAAIELIDAALAHAGQAV